MIFRKGNALVTFNTKYSYLSIAKVLRKRETHGREESFGDKKRFFII